MTFYSGMLGFEPTENAFFEGFRKEGFHPERFPYPEEMERNKFLPWPQKVAEVIRYFYGDTTRLALNTVFVGHSEGGLISFVLGAIADGVTLANLRRGLDSVDGTTLEGVTEEAFAKLVARLKTCRYYAVGSPLNGVTLNEVGDYLDRKIVQPQVGCFVRALTHPVLETFYKTIGRTPAQVFKKPGNGIAYSRGTRRTTPPKGLVPRIVTGMVDGGLWTFSKLVVRKGRTDGITPEEAVLLGEGVRVLLLDGPHLEQVESEANGRRLGADIRSAVTN